MDPTVMESDGPMWGTMGTQGHDERPLCPRCIRPLRPDAHFCKRCTAPVSSYASFGMFGEGNYEAIWSTGWMLGEAINSPGPRPMHAWVVTLVFVPAIVVQLAWFPHAVALSLLPDVYFPPVPGLLGGLVYLVLLWIQFEFIRRAWKQHWPLDDDPFEQA